MRLTSKIHKSALVLISLGLLVTAAGGVYSLVYRFHGYLRLTEGESVLEANKSYQDLRTGWVRPNPEYQWGIQLEQVALRYSATGDISEIAANLFLFDQHENKGYQGVAGLAHPLMAGDLRISPVSIGVSPALDVYDQDGKLIWRGAPKLDILDKQARKTDLFTVQETEYITSFFPASRLIRGEMVNASLTPTNPVFVFAVADEGISKPVPVGGESVKVGQYSIKVPGYRYWLEFEVSSKAGVNLFYIGLVLLFLGCGIALIMARKQQFRGERA